MASTAEELSSQADMLSEMVAAFVVDGGIQFDDFQTASSTRTNVIPQPQIKHFDSGSSSVRKDDKLVDVVGSVDIKDDDFEQY